MRTQGLRASGPQGLRASGPQGLRASGPQGLRAYRTKGHDDPVLAERVENLGIFFGTG
jgi:hypothetical protein